MCVGVNCVSFVLVLLGVLRNRETKTQIVGNLRIICEKVQEFEIMKSG